MKGDLRCEDGRLMRHDPQADDPYLETDRGVCPECDGRGCVETCPECGATEPCYPCASQGGLGADLLPEDPR